jgi:hypothetical protein
VCWLFCVGEGLVNYLFMLASNLDPPNLCLPSSYYRCELPVLGLQKIFFFSFVVLGFEIWASGLLGRHSTTWATSPALQKGFFKTRNG